jgi:hypothetical protein
MDVDITEWGAKLGADAFFPHEGSMNGIGQPCIRSFTSCLALPVKQKYFISFK